MKLKVNTDSIRVFISSEYSDIALQWEGVDFKRYHVWLDRKTRGLRDNTLYKNPPTGTPHKGPGYFDTRELNVLSEANIDAYMLVWKTAAENNLFELAEQKIVAERELERLRMENAARDRRIRGAGPELFEALRNLLDTAQFDYKDEKTRAAIAQAAKALRAAVPTQEPPAAHNTSHKLLDNVKPTVRTFIHGE